ncbi:hypothetical protein LX32DRAFT_298312 [Colletotrichum zoysiae]|uniref:Uncharacterized protein n=1 Tax=Colletotrichum zoysiae TaxID=1216348 RepID=A0AAD9LWB1_9PEZI|nr:hypothetical protein LX32DRAFT_298312 [Colletotrichum zoysiae]
MRSRHQPIISCACLPLPQPSVPPALAVKLPSSCQTSSIIPNACLLPCLLACLMPFRCRGSTVKNPPLNWHLPHIPAATHVRRNHATLSGGARARVCRVRLWETTFHDNQTSPAVKALGLSNPARDHDTPGVIALHPQHLNGPRNNFQQDPDVRASASRPPGSCH